MARLTSIIEPRREKFRGGFTLLECTIAVVILATSAVAIAGVLSASRAQTDVTQEFSTGQELARQLIEEIAAQPFADPDGLTLLGPEAGETNRSSFDNADDYHGYEDAIAWVEDGSPATAGNVDDVYTRRVRVEYRLTPSGSAAVAGDFAVVEVNVVGPSGRETRLWHLLTSVPFRR